MPSDDLANSIREFIHEKFQQIELPRFIRSVHVHSFEFGDKCPSVEIKELGDPWDEFYEDEEGESSSDGADGVGDKVRQEIVEGTGESTIMSNEKTADSFKKPMRPSDSSYNTSSTKASQQSSKPSDINLHPFLPHRTHSSLSQPPESPFLSGSTTPGIPGGTSNLSYFHLPLSTGLRSGTQTPLAAAFGSGKLDHLPARPSSPLQTAHLGQYWDISSRLSTATSSFNHRPRSSEEEQRIPAESQDADKGEQHDRSLDLQTTLHITYDGPLQLSLTAEILLDYPMQSFVGIPLALKITGLRFDGVALLAYVRSEGTKPARESRRGAAAATGVAVEQNEEEKARGRCHFCFLGPEEAKAVVGGEATRTASSEDNDRDHQDSKKEKMKTARSGAKEGDSGGLLREIRVETEIGRQEDGKQGLKNVGKVEKYVLEQVRRIFDEEFVWPSFWTFLV